MDTAGWYRRRELWLTEYRAANDGQEPACAVCGAEWTLRAGDLHHRTYARLGREDWRDLLAVCRPDHLLLHAFMERNPAWRRLPRDQATDLIAAWLRTSKEKASTNEQPR
jgi:hypothetical protein